MGEWGVKSRLESKKDEHVRHIIGLANVSCMARGKNLCWKTDPVTPFPGFPKRSKLSSNSIGYKMGVQFSWEPAHDRIHPSFVLFLHYTYIRRYITYPRCVSSYRQFVLLSFCVA